MRPDSHHPVPSDPDRSAPAGFAPAQRRVRGEHDPQVIELLLPVQLIAQLRREERQEREERQRQAAEAKEAERILADEVRAAIDRAAANRPPAFSQPASQPRTSVRAADNSSAIAREQGLWRNHACKAATANLRTQYPVFACAQGVDLFKRSLLQDREGKERLQQLYEQLSPKGSLRKIAQPQIAALKRLAATQPHMAGVVDFVLDQVALGKRGRRPQRLAPILLVGEPGIGKTHFAQGLARALGAPLSIQRLDSDLTGALWLGSDKKWSTSQHGLLFELLALGEAANPVVVLDEIDKIDRLRDRVQSGLYSVLEQVSASRLRDISLDFELDASLVTWIATANDASRLDEPLRSRFREFHIQVPTPEQCLVLAAEVMLATLREARVRGFVISTQRLERHLAHLTARQIQQATREALARAVKAGRKHLELRDLPEHVLDGEAMTGQSPGYLH